MSHHATDTIELAESLGVRTYIPERKMKGKLFGIGTPRTLQAEGGPFLSMQSVCFHIYGLLHRQHRVLETSRVDLELCATAA